VFSVRYELGFYIPEDGILHNRRRDNVKSYPTVRGQIELRNVNLVKAWNIFIPNRFHLWVAHLTKTFILCPKYSEIKSVKTTFEHFSRKSPDIYRSRGVDQSQNFMYKSCIWRKCI
jgi:hypothetical protein